MSESVGIDSISRETMPKPYSGDLRARVIDEIATGASRREAAERYGISASVVVIWAQRWEKSRQRCGKAEWREHLTTGGPRGISAGFDCRAPGLDAGRGRCGNGQTKDIRQPQRGLAVLRSTRHQL